MKFVYRKDIVTPEVQVIRITKGERDKHNHVVGIINNLVNNEDLDTFLSNNVITEFAFKGNEIKLNFKGGRKMKIIIEPLDIKFI